MKQLLLAALAASALALGSCKDEGTGKPYFEGPLTQELKDYTYFRNGTYWVYEDSATGDLDSFYVYDSQNFFTDYVDNSGEPLAKLEVFQYFTNSSYDGNTYYYLTDLINNRYSDHPEVTILRVMERNDTNTLNHFVHYPLEVGKEYQYGTSLMQLADRPDKVNFKHTFDDVLVYQDFANNTEGGETIFYIAKNMGIIRKEIKHTSKVWNLVRYKIVQ
ncbi:MAG TPA: hypothetical protein VEC12_11000 [Bacteroidia bacterium]|nr:hypothetical protein [Bacteroidia bacterium]